MSSRILLDELEPGAASDTHPAAPPPPEPTQPPPREAEREPAPPAEGGEPATEPPPPAEEPISAAAQARIDRLTRERYEAQRERDQVRAEWQRFQQQQQTPATPEQRARQEGYQQRQQEELGRTFDQACNDLYLKGRQEYGAEMDDAVAALRAVGWADRHDALAALTQLPEGHRVYRELARDLDRAARVLAMPPMAMAMELTRMAGGATMPRMPPAPANESPTEGVRPSVEVSRAPEPVRHIGGRSVQAERPLDHPQVTMAEFIRRRDRDQRRSRIAR